MTTTATAPERTLIRVSDVQAMTGLCRRTIDRYAKNATSGFPAKVKLTDTGTRQSAVAFVRQEIEAWITARANKITTANDGEEQ